MPLDVLRITEQERKAIRDSFDRTEEEIERDIKSLKQWMKIQPHLPQDEDEIRLRSMIVNNKFRLETSRKALDVYYSAKNFVPEYFENRAPLNPKVSDLLDKLIVMPLPNLTPEYHRVFYIRLQGEGFDLGTYLKIIFGMLDLCMIYDEALADQYILDLRNIQLTHLVQFTLANLKKSYEFLRQAYSDRIAGVHFINMPTIANTLFLLVNTILSQTLANRVYVHEDDEELCEMLSSRVLPNECGGIAGPINELYDDWKRYFKSKNDWLKDVAERKSDESKRVGSSFDPDMFGIHGSFGKLNID